MTPSLVDYAQASASAHRKLSRVIAAMATYTGPTPALADVARMAREEIGGWLSDYEGFRGLIILTDQDG